MMKMRDFVSGLSSLRVEVSHCNVITEVLVQPSVLQKIWRMKYSLFAYD